ncbi:MAG TPA: apolipoprotein N-acyltransferase [Candidatus Methylacidiphilales bacterium]|nr:apolipoprotein N-acyltransferase [Candidatus Methylacidiphilales bacterium]
MFDRWFDSYRRWWCALSGLLLVAGLAPFSSATCGWIALVPAWWVITRSERARRRPFRHGYLTGLIYFGGTFWWISNVTPIGAFFLVLYLALYPAVWFLLVTRLVARREGGTSPSVLLQATAAAALWVTLEWWRSWFLTGFNWNELGISQAPSIVFRQLAAFGGVHLISFVLVTVNVLWAEGVLGIAETLREKRVVRVSLPFAAALFIAASCFALGWHHLQRHDGETPGPTLNFACIQPDIPQIPYDGNESPGNFRETETEALEKTEAMSLRTIATGPDLLIWPEAMISEGVFNDRPMNEAVHDICENYDGYFLLGSQDFDLKDGPRKLDADGKGVKAPLLYNCAYFFSPYGKQCDEYRKTRLVILGEFLPFGDTFPKLREWAGVGMDFTPGPGPKLFTMKKPPLSFAPLICFEDTLPEVVDKAARLRPDFFVTITNDGWYTGWCAAWGVRQHLNHALFRCVEHDLPMIRCANTGISCQIDQNGRVTDRFLGASGREIDVGGVFSGTLKIYPAHGTLYERWGDWIVLISSLVSVMLGTRFLCRFSS